MVGKLFKLSQLLVEFPSLSCFDRCLIICQIPSPGTFSTRPTGEQRKKPPKISVASDTVKGPDIHLAVTSTASSWLINSKNSLAHGGPCCHSACKEMPSLGRTERKWGMLAQAKEVLDRAHSMGRMAPMPLGFGVCQRNV